MNNKEINKVKKCPCCNLEYTVRSPSEIKTRVYCSKKCQTDITRANRTKSNCLVCEKEMFLLPCHIKTKCCSMKCKGILSRKVKDGKSRTCNKCHTLKPIDGFYKCNKLIDYVCSSCRKAMNFSKQRSPSGRFTFGKSLAKRRGHEWNISKELYFELISSTCHYCNHSLDDTGVGLDRKDNSKGYVEGNVVPCCGACNTGRSDNFTYEEMLILGKTIKEIKEARKSI